MFNQIFVAYLVESGLLTQEQGDETLEAARNARERVGVLAVASGLMTPADAQKINDLQVRQNAKFGDIAIANKILTKKQFEGLLARQPKAHLILKQLLNENNYMSAEDFEQAICAFQKHLGVDDDLYQLLKEGDIASYISTIAGITKDDFIFNRFAELFISVVFRLVSSRVHIKPALHVSSLEFVHMFAQRTRGDGDYVFAFAANCAAATSFAEIYGRLPLNDGVCENARDSLKEFLNCVSGILVGEFYNKKNIDLEIDVPQYYKDKKLEQSTVILPFSLPVGDFVLTML